MSGLKDNQITYYKTFVEAIDKCDTSQNLYAIINPDFEKTDSDFEFFQCSATGDIASADKYISEHVNMNMITKLQDAFGNDNSAVDNFCVLAGRHIGKLYRYETGQGGKCLESNVKVLVTDARDETDEDDTDEHELDVTVDAGWNPPNYTVYNFEPADDAVETPEMVFVSPNGGNNANAILTGKDSTDVEKDLVGLLCPGDDMKLVRKTYYADKTDTNNPGSDLIIKECNPDAEAGDTDACKQPTDYTADLTIAYYDRFECQNSSSALLSAFMLVTSLSMFLF